VSLTFSTPIYSHLPSSDGKMKQKGVVGFCKTYPMISNSRNLKSIVISILLYKSGLVESPLVWQKNGVRLNCLSSLCQRSGR